VVLKKIKKHLASPQTSLLLIIIFLAACIIGMSVPQITDKSPSYFELWKEKNIYIYRFVTRLQLHKVYTSIWFLCAMSLTLISLGYSLYSQIKKNLLKRNLSVNPEQNRENISVVSRKLINSYDVRQLFRKKSYRITSTEPGRDKLIFSKNSLGRWGSTVLHTGIFLVILSAFFTFAFQKRGFVQIIKGDTFSGNQSDFLVKDLGVFAEDFSLDFTTRLSLLNHKYHESNEIKNLESIIFIDDKKGNGRREVIGPNEPLNFKGAKIYQSYNYGYTLSFMLKKTDGQEIITHFNLDMTKKKDKPLIGKSAFPTVPYIFEMKFLPDLKGTSFFITKPIVYLTISEMITRDMMFNGLLLPKHSIKIKDDILSFIGITEWSGLIFTQNPSMHLSYFGFALIIIGVIVMFGFPYKEVCTSIQKSGGETIIYAYVHTMRYPATFKEEVRDILEHLV
jgi:cytochrome c biogenesis protein ResB